MRRKLFLHIGSHRTATTSTQEFMQQNFHRLLRQGLLYPFAVPRHRGLMLRIFSGEENANDVARDMHKRADSKAHEVHSIALSDEDISMRRDLSPLLPFLDHFDVKIVFTMRRQDLWLESWYYQNIKWQWIPHLSHCTFDEFLTRREDFHWIHYDTFLRRYESRFGAENILVNVFEKEQMPDGPVMAFVKKLGLADLSELQTPPHVNSSLSAEMVEFTRHLPLDTLPPPERDILCRTLEELDREILGNTERQSERLMPHDQRRAILAEYSDGNRAVAQRYFQRDNLFLSALPGPDAPLADLSIPTDSAALMKRYVGPLVQQLVSRGTISAAHKRKPKGS